MTGNNASLSPTPSNYTGSDLPVEQVSWDDIQIFLERLNEQEADNLPPGWAYVLPTEAQWEYACRAGTTTAYSWGDEINASLANYDNNIGQTANVGSYGANPWGFFDMHGNVWEWVTDWYAESCEAGPLTDPTGAASGRIEWVGVVPGTTLVRPCVRLKRLGGTPDHRGGDVGFRVGFQYDNKAPVDLNHTAPLVVAENQPMGTILGTFTSTDVDSNPTLSYYLINGAGDTDNSLFALETNGTLKTATTFDYEADASTYSIRVQVRDEFNASMEGNFTVTLENANEAPFNLHNTGPLTMAENAPINTVVGNFNASDPDTGTVLTYSLVNGAGDGDNSLFSMEANMGRLRTAAMFDYENNASSYSIRVAVSDSYGLSTEQSFTVALTDVIENLPPVDLNSSAELTITENQPIGTLVGHITASDPDGDPLVYSLVSGPGDGNNSSFFLDANGSLSTALSFDFESGSALSIRVRVADESNANMEENFMVQVVDLDEVAPTLILNGSNPLFHSLGTVFNDPGANWTDDVDGSGMVVSTSDFNNSQVGTYILNYEFFDMAGNQAAGVSRTVYVRDRTPPFVNLVGTDTITHEAGTPYQDPGALWSDNLDGNGTVGPTGQVDVMTPGVYVLQFDCEDEAGNQAVTLNRTVIVEDTQPPVISLIGPSVIEVDCRDSI